MNEQPEWFCRSTSDHPDGTNRRYYVSRDGKRMAWRLAIAGVPTTYFLQELLTGDWLYINITRSAEHYIRFPTWEEAEAFAVQRLLAASAARYLMGMS